MSALIKGLAKKMSSMSTDGPFGGRDIPDQVTDENLNGEAFLMFAKLRERAATIPSLAWLTGHARDAVRIAVCFAGFDCRALVDRLIHAKRQGERVNVATVYRVIGEMSAAWDAHSREGARMPTVMLEVTYDDIDDMRSILRGLRQREGRERSRTLNLARLVAISSLADAIEQHIHDATTARLLPREDASP